jgi:hypothetical protein
MTIYLAFLIRSDFLITAGLEHNLGLDLTALTTFFSLQNPNFLNKASRSAMLISLIFSIGDSSGFITIFFFAGILNRFLSFITVISIGSNLFFSLKISMSNIEACPGLGFPRFLDDLGNKTNFR